MDKRFEAKRDIFIYIALLICLAAVVVSAIYLPREDVWSYAVIIASLCLVVLFLLLCICRTYYVLKENYLLIVSGIMKNKVFYHNIEKVEPNVSLWASSALSFDRIKITTGQNFWQREYIAVKDKEGMLAELQMRAKKSQNLLNNRKDINE